MSSYLGACLSAPIRPSSDDSSDLLAGEAPLYTDQLWDNGGTLKYGFHSGTPIQQMKVAETIHEWLEYANITFQVVKDIDDATIRISFDPKQASWAFVGKSAVDGPSDAPTMNLALDEEETLTDQARGVILHQFGHVLGLGHELRSPATGGVRLRRDYMIKAFGGEPNNWSADDVDKNLLDVVSKRGLTNYTTVDLTSIMIYYMPGEQNEEDIRIAPNSNLSEDDKAFMRIHYPYFQPQPQKAKSVFLSSLDTLGVDQSTQQIMIEHYKNGNVAQIRQAFGKCNSRV